jgi:hypothetical protein
MVVVASDREIETAIMRHYRGQEPAMSSRYTGESQRQDTTTTSGGEEDEFKVVDMSGNTVVKRVADIQPPQAAAPAPAPSTSSGGASAADLLDEILSGGSAEPPGLTPEEMQRLDTVRMNQEKSSKILRALLELLLEKGSLTQKELATRMRS